MARLYVKVIPKASRSEISGRMGEVLKVRVTAAPERGKANAAVCEVIAALAQVPRERLRLVAGRARERKIFEIEGLADDELRERIDRHLRG